MERSCPPCPDCGDSPLSTTGNILGILTFALGLVVSLFALLAVVRGAEHEVGFLVSSLEETGKQIRHSREYFHLLDVESDDDLQYMRDLTLAALNDLETSQRGMMEDLVRTQSSISSFWTRLDWWYRQKDVAAELSKLDSQKHHLNSIQLTFLLRKIKAQNDTVLMVNRYTRELWDAKRALDGNA
ncbi:hypothetical protein PT974_04852 [Cladobotryum mycophilum]|uniref:Fungal N-terminal domain-containing protein n=1 Tax=Cladobotryum mycophilum TaxID=491253 RepID=A0ABR0SQD0_9HYPO